MLYAGGFGVGFFAVADEQAPGEVAALRGGAASEDLPEVLFQHVSREGECAG